MINVSNRLTLVLGGARSGKSRYAQQIAVDSGLPVLFVATATPGDEEMAQRIAAHRDSRPPGWQTLEAPLKVGSAIARLSPKGLVLVDCLTLLASNVLFTLPESASQAEYEAALDLEADALLAAYRQASAEWVIISNEVGLGLVPAYPSGRLYRDALGRLNQQVAEIADHVILMVAGLPVKLKG